MMRFIRTIKNMYAMSQRIETLESEVNELEEKLKGSIDNYSNQFEKKIQQMSFAYTKNLDDTKSDYLKKYLETRMNCIQESIKQIPHRMVAMERELKALILEKDE